MRFQCWRACGDYNPAGATAAFDRDRRQSATIEFGRELTMSVLKRRLLIMVAAAIISFVLYVLWCSFFATGDIIDF